MRKRRESLRIVHLIVFFQTLLLLRITLNVGALNVGGTHCFMPMRRVIVNRPYRRAGKRLESIHCYSNRNREYFFFPVLNTMTDSLAKSFTVRIRSTDSHRRLLM